MGLTFIERKQIRRQTTESGSVATMHNFRNCDKMRLFIAI